jgi:DNA polymerase-3 subunit delta'
MPIVPVFGHEELRRRLADARSRGALPASILFHGPRGVGKQRLAIWLAQLLLCDRPAAEPCAACQHCRFVEELRHPDVSWYFPRPRLRDSDPDLADVREDYADAVAERVADDGLYAPPSGAEGIFIATVRALVQQAAMSPALGRRKVFVVGDAERMVPQEGSEQAANAFLKLLEEPPDDTTVIVTSSEPGALLPTIRSRVTSFRVAPLTSSAAKAFLAHPAVVKRLKGERVPSSVEDRVRFASGAPGRLLWGAEWSVALDTAERMLASIGAKGGKTEHRYDVAWQQASSKARGSFADTLDALSVAVHARARDAAARGSQRQALGASRAMEAIEVAKERITTNVNPQLITANLLRELEELLA